MQEEVKFTMPDFATLMIDTILPELKAGNQKQAFQIITEYAARGTGLRQDKLMGRLTALERTGSCSGIGNGVSVLHLVMKDLDRPFSLFARATQPVEYDSVDGRPVDLFMLVISPESDGPYHLQRLARISRMLRDQDLCRNLRHADSVDALQALLFDSSNRSLAA